MVLRGNFQLVWEGKKSWSPMLVSKDMVNWKQYSFIIDAKKLPKDCPYDGRFWAPEIHFIKGKYYLIVNSGKVTKEDPKGIATHSIGCRPIK